MNSIDNLHKVLQHAQHTLDSMKKQALEFGIDYPDYDAACFYLAGICGNIANIIGKIEDSSVYVPENISTLNGMLHRHMLTRFTIEEIRHAFSIKNQVYFITNLEGISPEVGLLHNQHCTDMQYDTSTFNHTHIPDERDYILVEYHMDRINPFGICENSFMCEGSYGYQDEEIDTRHMAQLGDFMGDSLFMKYTEDI